MEAGSKRRVRDEGAIPVQGSGGLAVRGAGVVSVYLVALAALALPCVLVFASPLALASGWTEIGLLCRSFFASVCHQRQDRSFLVAGQPLAVCARCTGFYLGLLAGALLSVAVRLLSAASCRAACQRIERFAVTPRRSVLLALLGPAVLHPLASRVGLVPDWSTLRAATAFAAATTASMLVVPSLAQIFALSGIHPVHRQPVPGHAATFRPPSGGGA